MPVRVSFSVSVKFLFFNISLCRDMKNTMRHKIKRIFLIAVATYVIAPTAICLCEKITKRPVLSGDCRIENLQKQTISDFDTIFFGRAGFYEKDKYVEDYHVWVWKGGYEIDNTCATCRKTILLKANGYLFAFEDVKSIRDILAILQFIIYYFVYSVV